MRLIKRIIVSFYILSFPIWSSAQVFNCDVQVIAPTLQNNPANEEIFSSLKNAILEFVNYGFTWTNDVFEQGEQIDVSFLLTINDKNGNNFNGKLQVTSKRPVFNSDYKTMLFNYIDPNVSFEYIRNSPIQYYEGQHINNLADLMAFYIYVLLGFDYDSFSFEGGTTYFNKADQIVTNCQSAAESGWKSGDGDNSRFWLIQNTLQPQYSAIRKCYYYYHINGLDKCYQDRVGGIQSISSAINDLMSVHSYRPSSFNMQLFFNAKSEEIIKIYTPSEPEVRAKMYDLLAQLDPSRIKNYNVLK